jgi:hypothetical protein
MFPARSSVNDKERKRKEKEKKCSLWLWGSIASRQGRAMTTPTPDWA